jgi:hypothetical protein
MQGVLAAPAARIENCSVEFAFGCQTHDCWLRLANIPRRRPVMVRRIPWQSRHPLVTGWVPTIEWIVNEASWSIRHLRPLQLILSHIVARKMPLVVNGKATRSRANQKNTVSLPF